MNSASPVRGTCGLLLFVQAKTLCSKQLTFQASQQTAEIALSLVEPLLKKGHMLWMDNFYNSPALAERLKSLNTNCVGTLRLNRKDVPKTLKEKRLKKGEMIAQHSGSCLFEVA